MLLHQLAYFCKLAMGLVVREGPPQTNVVHVPTSHLGQNLCMISNYNYTSYPFHLSCSFALLHQLGYFCVVIVAFEGTRWLLNNIGLVLYNQASGTPCFIFVPTTTSYNNSMYSTSRSCLHSFLCNPYIPFEI